MSCSVIVSSTRIGKASSCRKDKGVGASDWALVTVNDPLDTPRIGVDARRGVDMLILLEN